MNTIIYIPTTLTIINFKHTHSLKLYGDDFFFFKVTNKILLTVNLFYYLKKHLFFFKFRSKFRLPRILLQRFFCFFLLNFKILHNIIIIIQRF